jgi:hypothetical protein
MDGTIAIPRLMARDDSTLVARASVDAKPDLAVSTSSAQSPFQENIAQHGNRSASMVWLANGDVYYSRDLEMERRPNAE